MRVARAWGVAVVALVVASGLVAPGDGHADVPSGAGLFVPVPAARKVDTRRGIGAPAAPIPAHGVLTVSTSALVGTSYLGAVDAHVTVTGPGAAGYLSAYPADRGPATTSLLNFTAGATVSNQALLTGDDHAEVAFYNGSSAPVQLIVDVDGYYTYGLGTDIGGYSALLTPQRVLDTRKTARVPAHGRVTLSAGADTPAYNLTVTNASAAGYLSVVPHGAPAGVSNLNFAAGDTRANMVIANSSADGLVDVFNGSIRPVDVIVDKWGSFLTTNRTNEAGLAILPPTRRIDTRTSHAIAAGASVTVQLSGAGGIPPGAGSGAWINLTATNAQAAGYLTLSNGTGPTGATSALNFVPGHTLANLVQVPVAGDGTVHVYNRSTRPVDVLVDLDAYVMQPVASPLTWHTPLAVDPPHGAVDSISCPTASFCAAVDTAGNAIVFNGASWSAVIPVVKDFALGGSVSCSSATFCLAVWSDAQSSDQYSVFDGLSWTAPAPVPAVGGSDSVSCVSNSFCMLVGSGNNWAISFDGTSWSNATELSFPGNGGEARVSCVSSTRCVATGWSTYATIWNGTTWSHAQLLDPAPADSITGLSCPDATTCYATDGNAVLTLTGTTWSGPSPVQGAQYLNAISCTSATSCVALDTDQSLVLSGSTWTAKPTGLHEPHAVSCVSASWCAATGDTSKAMGFNGTAWSTPVQIDQPQGELSSVSCPSPTTCVGADFDGNVVGFGPNGAFTAVTPLTPGVPISQLSCRTMSDCAALADGTEIDFGSGTTHIGINAHVNDVSCTTGRCTAVDAAGSVWVRTPTTWTRQTTLPTTMTTISCASDTFCLAYGAGKLYKTNGTAWSAVPSIAATGSAAGLVERLTCTSATLCVAQAQDQTVSIFDGTRWTTSPPPDNQYFGRYSCFGTQCYSVNDDGRFYYFDGVTWQRYDFVIAQPFVNGLDCYNATACVAVGWNGYATFGTA